MGELQRWRMLSDDEKREGGKPPEPHSFIVNDATLEKLQLILAANPRGTLVLKDELEELGVAETVGGGLLEADGQVGAEAGKAQLTQCGINLGHGGKATR